LTFSGGIVAWRPNASSVHAIAHARREDQRCAGVQRPTVRM
jgi:hypothetical protein